MPAALLPSLTHHLQMYTPPQRTAPVLVNSRDLRVSQSALDRAWRTARERAGRPGFHFHNLRHTGLTKYAEQGATLAELLHRGGHTDVTVARRYQHATAQRDRALTDLLSKEIEAWPAEFLGGRSGSWPHARDTAECRAYRCVPDASELLHSAHLGLPPAVASWSDILILISSERGSRWSRS